jgi:hypothetical protein
MARAGRGGWDGGAATFRAKNRADSVERLRLQGKRGAGARASGLYFEGGAGSALSGRRAGIVRLSWPRELLVEDSPEEHRRRWRRRLFFAAGLPATLCVLAIAWAFQFCLHQRHRVESAVAAIRARGEPVMPEEIAIPPRGSPSRFAENVEGCRAIFHRTYEEFCSESDIDDFLTDPESSSADPGTIAALRELRACLEASRKGGDDLQRFQWDRLSDSIAEGIEPSDCEHLAHRARRLCLDPAIEAASRLCLGDPEDFASLLGRPDLGPITDDCATAVSTATRFLAASAVDLALEGRLEEALTRVRTALRGGRIVESGFTRIPLRAWEDSELHALNGLRAILTRLPAGLDLRDLEGDFDPQEPRRYLIRALQGERAIMNRFYALLALRIGAFDLVRRPWRTLTSLPWETVLYRDQANYLDLMARGIEGASLPYRTWKERSDRNHLSFEPSGGWFPLAVMLDPGIPQQFSNCAQVEAGILLARAALTAYHEGEEAGAQEASSSTDPFSGNPIHTRVDPDGTLVLWSVGKNLVDDGGVTGDLAEDTPKDLVWRIPKR